MSLQQQFIGRPYLPLAAAAWLSAALRAAAVAHGGVHADLPAHAGGAHAALPWPRDVGARALRGSCQAASRGAPCPGSVSMPCATEASVWWHRSMSRRPRSWRPFCRCLFCTKKPLPKASCPRRDHADLRGVEFFARIVPSGSGTETAKQNQHSGVSVHRARRDAILSTSYSFARKRNVEASRAAHGALSLVSWRRVVACLALEVREVAQRLWRRSHATGPKGIQ